jgi:hypothetical protein
MAPNFHDSRGAYPGTPRWVKAVAAVGGLLALLLVVMHLMGHGFSHHGAHSEPTSQTLAP